MDNSKKEMEVIPMRESVEIFRNAGVAFEMKLLFGVRVSLPLVPDANTEVVHSLTQTTQFIPDEETIKKYGKAITDSVMKDGIFKGECRFIGFEYIRPVKVPRNEGDTCIKPIEVKEEDKDS